MKIIHFFLPFTSFKQQLYLLLHKGTITEKLLFFAYVIFSIILLLFSYTQIDLGLVISRVQFLYNIEKAFQYIGYFNRPLSTLLFCIVALLAFILYFLTIRLQKKISLFTVWSIIGLLTIVLTFSYNLLSYDFFNYIFDAKILTHYHANPYVHRAQDFPHDPMLGFMRWTDRTYTNAYGPVWLLITIPFSFIGGNIFIITFYLFKMLMSASYLGSVYFIYKIAKKIQPEKVVQSLILFALNPLIIFEFLVTSHNDIVMIFFALWSIYLFIEKKYIRSLLFLMVSVLIKYATIFLFPVLLLIAYLQKYKKDVSWQRYFLLMLCLMTAAILLVINRTEFQPWYLLYLLMFLPFIQQKIIQSVLILLSLLAQLTYLPYFYTGLWDSIWFTGQEDAYHYFFLTVTGIAIIYFIFDMYQLLRKK